MPTHHPNDDNLLGLVVVAAGRSSRMAGTDKTFADIHGLPLIAHTLLRLAHSHAVARIVLVVAPQSLARSQALVHQLSIPKIQAVCPGGARRQDSVYAGLTALGPCRWVAVHDGARPCISHAVLARALDAVRRHSATVAAIPVKDTIKIVDHSGVITATPNRDTLWAAQTPQAFDYNLLLSAHHAADADYTDDAAIAEAAGHTVHIFPGSPHNLKVTTPEDLAIVRHLLTNAPVIA